MNASQLKSKHFELQQIADDVYAAFAVDIGAADCNAGIINLGNLVVIFDTFQTPQAAQDLRRIATHLYGQTQRIVLNSHWHNDHFLGNQVFAEESQIISSSRTRQLILSNSLEEIEWYIDNAARQLTSYQTQLQTAPNEKREELRLRVCWFQGLVEALPHLSLCLPSITFDHHLTLHGTKSSAELIEFENGHTASDSVLYLPQARVVFMSDLLFTNFHPYLGDGDPQGLQAALRTLGKIEADQFVPGHGLLGTKDDLQKLINYIDYCTETAKNLVSEGPGYEEKVAKLTLADHYQSWQIPSFFSANIRFLCKQMESTALK